MLVDRPTRVPPYVGVPRLSHQFPAVVVVAVVVTTADVVVDVMVNVGVVDVLDVVLVVLVDVALDLAQDARTSDITMRKVSTIQINPLFI